MGISETTTSTSLLCGLREQDAESWKRFVRLYGPLVFSWCRRRGLDEATAADVVQDVFLSVASHIADFRRERASDGLRRWMFTITRNKIRDYFRRLASHPRGVGGSTANAMWQQIDGGNEEDRDESLEAQETGDRMEFRNRALALARQQFRDEIWQAFWRTAVEGDKPADVARDLDVTVWFVYKAKSRVLNQLRDDLEAF